MSRALTSVEILAAHKKWGCPVVESSGWKSRSNGGSWSGVVGLMDHHTAMDASDAVNLRVLIAGRTGLSGPLCNFGVGDDGIIDLIAAGPANHAGKGDPGTLAKVKSENYTGNITPDQSSASPTSVGGNSKFYGYECYYGIGSDLTPKPIQYRAMVLSNAAMVDALDRVDTTATWTSKSVIGHKEWTTAKIDPRNINMTNLRADVQWCLTSGPALAAHWYRTGQRALPVPVPPVPASKVVDMSVLVRVTGTKAVWLSDLITRRWVVNTADLDVVKAHMKAKGLSTDTEVVESLTGYGVQIGPDPIETPPTTPGVPA